MNVNHVKVQMNALLMRNSARYVRSAVITYEATHVIIVIN